MATCDECLKPIKATMAMVSVGYAGAINYQYFHNKCFLVRKEREFGKELWAPQLEPAQVSDIAYGDGKL